MSNINIFFIPGLAFDKRIFKNLDLSEYNCHYIEWIEPEKNEHLIDYSKRMIQDFVFDESATNVIVGHSFGGVIAQEIASSVKVDQIILISSIKSRDENPWHFKIVAPLRLHYLFRKYATLLFFPLWGSWHDYKTKEEQDLFKSMISKQSNHYLRWALQNLSLWKGPDRNKNYSLFHIHGKKDKILPYKIVKAPDVTYEDGGHILIFKKGLEITAIIKKQISILTSV